MTDGAQKFRYVSSDRRVREDRRFVAGKGRFVADIALPGMRHVALVTCPYAAARITGMDKSAALAVPGVHYVLDGIELAGATLPLATGLDTPNVPRRPLAVDVARYCGEWVAAVVADTRAIAEDAAELAYLTLCELGLEPVAVFDQRPGRRFLRFEVRDVRELAARDFDAIVVATFDKPEPHVAALTALGVPRDRVVTLRQ